MSMTFPDPKDPAEDLDYKFDWTDALADAETIESATVTVAAVEGDASPLTISTVTNTNTTVNFRAQAGTANVSYVISCTAVTSNGNTMNRKAKLKVKDL